MNPNSERHVSPAARERHLFRHGEGGAFLWLLLILLFAAASPARTQTLHCGDVVQGTLAISGGTNAYRLDAVAGEVIRLTSVYIFWFQ